MSSLENVPLRICFDVDGVLTVIDGEYANREPYLQTIEIIRSDQLERTPVPKLDHHLLLSSRLPYLLRKRPIYPSLPTMTIHSIPHRLPCLTVLWKHVPVVPYPLMCLHRYMVKINLVFTSTSMPLTHRPLTSTNQIPPQGILIRPWCPFVR